MSNESIIQVYDFEPAADTLRRDVLEALARRPRLLPSQYLYDDRGAMLFERICETEEYYITRTEIDILDRHMPEIAACIGPGAVVIEPGSGSGVKTRMLLEGLDRPAGYVPIDVARRQLVAFAAAVDQEFPDLSVLPVCADFTGDYDLPPETPGPCRRLAYCPGSTIGNFTAPDAVDLLRRMGDLCVDGGGALVGVDLEKDPALLERAYDDADGVSRAFALNYLVRLNRDLDADFDLSRFDYEAPYNPDHGRVEMALVSLCDQVVHIGDHSVAFAAGERIGTEYSYKYTLADFSKLAGQAGLRLEQAWTDPDGLFSVNFLAPANAVSAS